LEFALAADWRLATPKSKLGFPEALLGAFPAGGAIPLLTRLVGRHRARQMMLTADVLTGERSLALGLVDEVVEADALLARAQVLADVFARRAYGSVRAVKALTADTLADSRERIVAWMRRIYAGRDIHEGLQAFREKREPVFDTEWSAHGEAE
jgi:enoyl-CoA hydratase